MKSNNPPGLGCYPGCFYYGDSCYRTDCLHKEDTHGDRNDGRQEAARGPGEAREAAPAGGASAGGPGAVPLTDRQQLEAIFTRAGIVFSDWLSELSIEARDGPKNLGYSGFYASMAFDEHGALVTITIAE